MDLKKKGSHIDLCHVWVRPEQVKVRELRQVGIEACAIMREGESEKQVLFLSVYVLLWLLDLLCNYIS